MRPNPFAMTDEQGIVDLGGTDFSAAGKNPHGKPLFRCILAPSRIEPVWVASENGGREMMMLPTYPGIEGWVLERWLPPHLYGGTKTSWDEASRGTIDFGPYPSQGGYAGCFIFPEKPSWSFVKSVIDAIAAGDRFTLAQKQKAIEEAHTRREAEVAAKRAAIIDNAMPAFGLGAVSVNPARKTPDQINLKPITAPTEHGKFFQMKVRKNARTTE